MKKLQICIIDLIHNSASQSLYRRIMFPNYISIMPQIIGVWCMEEGHDVIYSIYTGSQNLKDLIPDQTDLVFISSFTHTSQLAYALSNYARQQGIATILGGPHARSYPEDASHYFDYVLGLTNKDLIKDLLCSFEINSPPGMRLSSSSQPSTIPGVQERWELIKKVHHPLNIIKITPLLGSFGCPYKCDFCVDSEIPYQSLDMGMIKNDLQFLIKKSKHPKVSWYDPNFGVKFNSIMETIESVVPSGNIDFIAECSLSGLNEDRVKRLNRNGFKMIMPGIESWFDYGNKSKTGSNFGIEKVKQVAEQVNMIQYYIPQVQTNFMFGLDADEGNAPFELTKKFIDLAPAVYPSFALLSIFGQGNKNNIKYETENRIIPFPFHYMMSVHTMNIIPKNYTWEEFYVYYIDLLNYCFSARAVSNRFNANKALAPKWITLLLSLTIGGKGKASHLSNVLKSLQKEKEFQSFVKKETNQIPRFMIEKVKKDLGPMWHFLPNKALTYNHNVLSNPI